jgi:hypothetical protein
MREPSKSAHAIASAARRVFHHDLARGLGNDLVYLQPSNRERKPARLDQQVEDRLISVGNSVDAAIAADLIEKWFVRTAGHRRLLRE